MASTIHRSCLTAYNAMGQNVRMNEYELHDYNAYSNWISLEIDQNDWQNGATFSQAQLATLNNLVDIHWMHRAGQKVMGYMNRHMGTDFYIPPARGNWQPRSALLLNQIMLEQLLVEVYPNPASTLITFELHLMPLIQINGTFNIYDVTHRLILSNQITNPSQMITIDTNEWQSGIYLFELITNGQSHSGKFEIQH